MNRLKLPLTALLLTTALVSLLSAHCEIPCGIYGDKTRITLLAEHITTVEKSIQQIQELSAKSDALSLNQAVRWIENKDAHSDKIQRIVSQYFLTQRIKARPEGDPARGSYLTQVTTLHQILVSAMKCKQTVDLAHVENLRSLVHQFEHAYFSPEDLKHLHEHK